MEGQRLIQGVTDLLLGWSSVDGVVRRVDFYVRQLRDRKGSMDATTLDADGLRSYRGCAASRSPAPTRARATPRPSPATSAPARRSTGRSPRSPWPDAQQNQDDYERLLHAVDEGREGPPGPLTAIGYGVMPM